MRSYDDHLTDPDFGSAFERGETAGLIDGCAGGSCGVLAHFLLDVDDAGVIVECSARVRGRAAAFAAASAFCEAARGRTVVDAARLGLGTLHPSFGQLDDEACDRALVVEDGFHHALGRWAFDQMQAAGPGVGRNRPAIPAAIADVAQRPAVIVGMSGGVDSAIALHREHERAGSGGAIGATLRLWIDPRAPDPDSACCSPDSVRRARATCHAAGLPHLSIDLRESFARAVVVPFVTEYATGATPNPCIRCNGTFRLDELVRLADVLGAERIATGHYARIVERDGVALIARGVDGSKDQSYMLAQVAPETVARMSFPLGEEHKVDIRVEATARGLEQATTPESQEVCFLGGGDYREFLTRAGAMGTPGDLVLRDTDGSERVVGSHDGVARFTPGQRRGIGVSAHAPLYVMDVDPASGRVVVGTDPSDLDHHRVLLGELDLHARHLPQELFVQLRYRSRDGARPARLVLDETGAGAVLELLQTQRAPAPGQVAVLYDADGVVLGTGRICRDRSTVLVGARSDG